MSDRLYLRGKVYWCWYYDLRGRCHRRTTRCRDRRAAEAVLKRYEREAQGAPEAARDRAPHTVDDAVNDFVEHGCLDLSPQTVRMYEERGAQLLRVLGLLDVHELDVGRLQLYAKQRLEEGAARSTIAKEFITLRRSLGHARDTGKFFGDPRAPFPRFRAPYVPRDRYLTHEEFKKLIATLRPHRQLWLLVAVFTGGRDSEVDALQWQHIDWTERLVLLPGTKTEKSRRRVPLHPVLAKVLGTNRQKKGHVVGEWSNVRRDLEAACNRVMITKVTPNDLRRTYASWMKQAGVDSAAVAKAAWPRLDAHGRPGVRQSWMVTLSVGR